MSMRPQDVLVAVKLAVGSRLTYPELAAALEMSLSEVHGAVKRATDAGLVGPDRTANRVALLEFLLNGVKHAFVPKRGELTRGMPTAHGAPPLDQLVGVGMGPPPVWPDPEGTVRGESFAPLYRSVPKAAKKDPKLYQALCLIDAIRGGRPRDRALAEQHLRKLFSLREVFSITAPHRDRIVRGLAKIGPGPESFYRGALEILALDPPLATTGHLVGHLAREIESGLRHLLHEMRDITAEEPKGRSNPKKDGSPKPDVGHREMIRSALAVLGISIDGPLAQAWLARAGKENQQAFHRLAHRDDLNPPRAINADFLRFWEEFEEILDGVLDGLEKKYLLVLKRLDRLLAKSSPTTDDARMLRGKIPQSLVALEYFFGKLDNPSWIQPLEEVGFFSTPPSPMHEGRGVTYPSWPALQYLVRMASRASEEVAGIALAVPRTDNSTVHKTLARIALGLPPKLAASFADRVDGWLAASATSPDLDGRTEVLTDLIAKLGTGGQKDAALLALHSLLRPVEEAGIEDDRPFRREPETRLTNWGLRGAMEKLSPTIAALGEPALTMLCDLLEETILLSFSGTALDTWDDQSWTWRPAIEDHARNRSDDLLSLLVAATRDAAVRLVEADSTRLSEIVASLESRNRDVFRRLALHLLVLFAEKAPELVATRILNRSSFRSHGIEHEYVRLLRTSFASLSAQGQAEILSWIHDGPTQFLQEDRSGYVERWTLRWLTVIAEALPKNWRARFEALKATHGEQAPPDELSLPSTVTGPQSPFLHEDLVRMTPDQLVHAVASLPPSELGAPRSVDPWRQIASVVEQKPDVYAANAKVLERLDPSSLFGVLHGLRSAVKGGLTFNWTPVLDLCVWTTSPARRIRSQNKTALELDGQWGETRKAVLRLLSEGMTTNKVPIPSELRARVWAAIKPTLDDPDGKGVPRRRNPTSEAPSHARGRLAVSGFTGGLRDPKSEASHRVRGIALDTAIDYALWLARQGPSKGLPTEVRKVLESKLPELSDATRAIYGSRINGLTYLDADWCKAHSGAMFARDDEGRDPAWETYLEYENLNLDVFRVLRWRYRIAVDELRNDAALDRHNQALAEHVGDHLARLYWHDQIHFRDRDGLLDRFFTNAPPSVAGNAINRIGYWLHDETAPTAEAIERLKALWKKRVIPGRKEELEAFGPWFSSGRFEDDWALVHLQAVLVVGVLPLDTGRVVERLAVLVTRRPSQVVACLDLLVQADKRGSSVFHWRSSARTILTAARSSDDRQVRGAAESVINRLLEGGYVEFRDLLEEKTVS